MQQLPADPTGQKLVACSSNVQDSDASDKCQAAENWGQRIGFMWLEGPKHESYRRYIVGQQSDSYYDQSDPDN
jgi:hypothetical protein